MIKVLILYYLSIKPTHGYEIQKFIQVNHMDEWTKIQSGSIYYAINKLEKQKLIKLISESGNGSKARKTYAITDEGKKELKLLVQEELDKDIFSSGSDKFIIYPILNILNQDELRSKVTEHIGKLIDKMDCLKEWQDIKVNEQSLKVEKLSFEMMISSIEYQIKWHEALVEEMDKCILASNEISKLIKTLDFSNMDTNELFSTDSIKILEAEIKKNR